MPSESVELWKYGTYAHAWFADAQREAAVEGENAVRREIVFAVCAAESYLLEWVRDGILESDFRSPRLNHYFPVDSKKKSLGIVERWRNVIEHLNEDGTISGLPDLGQAFWSDFNKLVDFRNGLVHGRASRPDTEGLKPKEKPEPTVEELQKLTKGWATKVVEQLIRTLHEAVGTSPPNWLPMAKF